MGNGHPCGHSGQWQPWSHSPCCWLWPATTLPSPGNRELQEGSSAAEGKSTDKVGSKETCSVWGTKMCRQLSFVIAAVCIYGESKKLAKRFFFLIGVFLFLERVCACNRLTVCVCIHFAAEWLSLGSGSLGASEIQTWDVNNIAGGMLDSVLWYPREVAYCLQFSESSWAFKFPSPLILNLLLSIETIFSCLFLQQASIQISSVHILSICPLSSFVLWKMRLCSCWLTDFIV